MTFVKFSWAFWDPRVYTHKNVYSATVPEDFNAVPTFGFHQDSGMQNDIRNALPDHSHPVAPRMSLKCGAVEANFSPFLKLSSGTPFGLNAAYYLTDCSRTAHGQHTTSRTARLLAAATLGLFLDLQTLTLPKGRPSSQPITPLGSGSRLVNMMTCVFIMMDFALKMMMDCVLKMMICAFKMMICVLKMMNLCI